MTKDEIRLHLATDLRRKYEAGQEVPGTEWLRSWAFAITNGAPDASKAWRGSEQRERVATP